MIKGLRNSGEGYGGQEMGMDISILEWTWKKWKVWGLLRSASFREDQIRRWNVTNVRKGWIEVEVCSLPSCHGWDC